MLVLSREQKQKLKQEKRNREINERCKRIHDPKWCLHGIDKSALDKQIEERREREEFERKSNEAYEKEWLQNLQKAYEMQKKEEEIRHNMEKEVNEYRLKYQAPQTRVSYDLNHPNILKCDTLPDRDNHDLVGPSSILNFIGEDLNGYNRRKLQSVQNKAWLDQQVIEKRKLKEQEKCIEEQHLQLSCSIQEKMCEKLKQDKEQKLIMEREVLEFNRKLAEEKAKKQHAEKCEIFSPGGYNMETRLGPVLTDDRSTSRCSLPAKDKEEYCKELEKQVQEIEKRKEHAVKSESEWEKQYVQMYREGLLFAREQERQRKQFTQQNMEENMKLAEEQKAIKQEVKKNVTAEICDEFFNRFEVSP